MPDLVRIRRALLSVSDKSGIVALARVLTDRGVEIISTGGTAELLAREGLAVTPIDRVTGFPEMLDGRVKTLHPKIHGGLLGRRDLPSHAEQMRAHDITPIDLLCVNLYPFERTIATPGCTREDAIENIDIGGPAMIRSASKNAADVAVVTSPEQYDALMREMKTHDGSTTLEFRASLAAQAFAHTARYDAAIARYLAPDTDPDSISLTLSLASTLRYGENPHQAAALYREAPSSEDGTIPGARQLHGKELSYNNILDAAAALDLAWSLAGAFPNRPGASVIKHTNPCGSAVADAPEHAAMEAIAGDPLAAYGGILALNVELTAAVAERLADKSIFLEVVAAPTFAPDAVAILKERSANIRLLATGPAPTAGVARQLRSIPGGMLVQDADRRLTPPAEFVHRAGPKPTPAQIDAARFMEPVTRQLLSNAVAIGGGSPDAAGALRLFGAGAGQMDRVASCRIAVQKAGANAQNAVAFSDAFFPFPDGPTILIDAGVKVLVHPGGSKRDAETFDLCEARGVTCLTTGIRHFRH